MNLDQDKIAHIMANLHKLPRDKQAATLKLVKELQKRQTRAVSQVHFLDFVQQMWAGFIMGRHHKIMAEKFEAVARGEIKRLAISLPPRHTKSEFASYLLPAWFLGNYPDKKIMQASHKADLAISFGRKVRNLVDSPAYKEIFPDVELQTDSKSAGRWGTNKGGVYNALGVGGGAAGMGADIFIIDDPHNEQDILNGNTDAFDTAWEWYMSGPRQRLQPGGGIIVVHTRWSKKDLIGKLLDYAAKNPEADQWEYIEFPAIMNEGTAFESSLWEEFWTLKELKKIQSTIAPHLWNAQYMQNPTGAEGALIKKEWWKIWEDETPPKCEFIIMSLDAAQEAHNRADYNALTTWGVFFNEEVDNYNIILLNAVKKRMEFPELKVMVLEEYRDWEPDSFMVEKKSNGAALYQELRRMGIPVGEFTPGKGQDKISRVNAVTDLFSSGIVWAPDKRWAHEVMAECSDFPNGDNDDLVDSTTLALIRFRQGGFIRLPSDEKDEIREYRRANNLYNI
jgi:predicted phage terminase large subunit-like protein